MAVTGHGKRAIGKAKRRVTFWLSRESYQVIENMDRGVLGLPELPADAKRQHTADKVRRLLEIAIAAYRRRADEPQGLGKEVDRRV